MMSHAHVLTLVAIGMIMLVCAALVWVVQLTEDDAIRPKDFDDAEKHRTLNTWPNW